MVKVSVIITVYNVEPYLERSLDCLHNQTLKDMEFIFIDDCSTDKSLEILKKHAQVDDRIKIIPLETNSGAAVARNKGLEVATGEYLGFIDPDDDIDLNYYEELYKKAKEKDYDIVKCQRKTIDTDGKVFLGTLNNEIKKTGNKFLFSYEWTTAIYKHSVIKNNSIKFPEECPKAQDIVFLNRVIIKAKNISIIDNVFYYYYKRDDSLNSKKISIKKIESALLAVELILNDYNMAYDNGLEANIYFDAYFSRLQSILNYTITQNDSFEAKKLCIEQYIKMFNMCKMPGELENHFGKLKQNKFITYVKTNNVQVLTDLFMEHGKFYGVWAKLMMNELKNKVREDIKV